MCMCELCALVYEPCVCYCVGCGCVVVGAVWVQSCVYVSCVDVWLCVSICTWNLGIIFKVCSPIDDSTPNVVQIKVTVSYQPHSQRRKPCHACTSLCCLVRFSFDNPGILHLQCRAGFMQFLDPINGGWWWHHNNWGDQALDLASYRIQHTNLCLMAQWPPRTEMCDGNVTVAATL